MLDRSFACPVYFIEQSDDVLNVYNTLQSKSGVLSVCPSSLHLNPAIEHLHDQREVPSHQVSPSPPRDPHHRKRPRRPQRRRFALLPSHHSPHRQLRFLLPRSLPRLRADRRRRQHRRASRDSPHVPPPLRRPENRGQVRGPRSLPSSYNLLFLLSGGAHLDFEGFRQWMIRSPPELFDTVHCVLSLDDLL